MNAGKYTWTMSDISYPEDEKMKTWMLEITGSVNHSKKNKLSSCINKNVGQQFLKSRKVSISPRMLADVELEFNRKIFKPRKPSRCLSFRIIHTVLDKLLMGKCMLKASATEPKDAQTDEHIDTNDIQ